MPPSGAAEGEAPPAADGEASEGTLVLAPLAPLAASGLALAAKPGHPLMEDEDDLSSARASSLAPAVRAAEVLTAAEAAEAPPLSGATVKATSKAVSGINEITSPTRGGGGN
mmetsp:Transcript_86728/g.280250  ORF Transcript_86728/g.280250 Transcript_86728/m.280250 type:complete len:112 (-) Transcript_86728:1198-1533(-)